MAASLLLASSFSGPAHAVSISAHPMLENIATKLIRQGVYKKDELTDLFDKVQVQQSVLDAMKNPAEYKYTWGRYRKLFMQQDRIDRAVLFWHDHSAALARAEKHYGVPVEIILAIIGVESKYGEYKGKHRVIDSLVSLVLDYPRRSKFFANELQHFLVLTKENQLDPLEILGSYAGAMGYPQFIASSHQHYAVDFSGDGLIDLINQPVDAIGSVANYLVKNGWLSGQPITSRAMHSIPPDLAVLANRKRKVQFTAQALRDLGAELSAPIESDEKLNVLMLNASEAPVVSAAQNVYLVRAGDTACQIAERFSVPCSKLAKLNNLNKRGTIYRGQQLKLPIGNKKPRVGKRSSDAQQWQLGGKNKKEKNQEIPHYFYTHENFYVITRYNQSVLYAMAVNDLSVAIHAARFPSSELP